MVRTGRLGREILTSGSKSIIITITSSISTIVSIYSILFIIIIHIYIYIYICIKCYAPAITTLTHNNKNNNNDKYNETISISNSYNRESSLPQFVANRRCLWKNTPPERRERGNISCWNTESGAGEQFLLLVCRAEARRKETVFSQTPVGGVDNGRACQAPGDWEGHALEDVQTLLRCRKDVDAPEFGQHYLSNATCLIRPQSCYALFVVIRHCWRKPALDK